MTFGDRRLSCSVALLCLPTAAAVALGAWIAAFELPEIVRSEKARASAETEQAAGRLRSGAAAPEFTWVRGKGVVSGSAGEYGAFPADMTWRQWNPDNKSAKSKEMWGWRPLPDGRRLVWSRGTGMESNTVFAAPADIAERDFGTAIAALLALFAAALAWTTFIGVKYFTGYVKSRDDFLAATAHDLKTPIAGMRLTIGRDDASAAILNERLLRIVANICDFLRLGGKRPEPRSETFSLADAYCEAYTLFREDYEDLLPGGVPVSFEECGEESLYVRADRTMAVQAMWNLLGNDLKYAAPSGPVEAVFSRRGGFAVLELRDKGPGMKPSEMKKAFDRYYRAKTAMESGKGGFGIGLCTAGEFAASMGGSLSVAPNVPHGCVFTLSLPAADADEPTSPRRR